MPTTLRDRDARRERSGLVRECLAALLAGALVLSVALPALVRPAHAHAAVASADAVLEVEVQARAVAERATRATVGLQVGPNLGSGVIVSREGHVLTAGHVVEGPGRRVRVTLSDGRVVRGVTLGVNRWVDSGMVRIEEEGDWPFLPMGEAATLEPGAWVLALGHPGGVEEGRPPVVRLGRVSSLDARVVRSDCTIVSGDSGGPLVDLEGRVVGIHTSLRRFLVANDHLPVDTYRRTWDRLVAGDSWGGGAVGRSFLGVSGRREDGGCRLDGVVEGLAAERAGMLAGDLVVEIGGVELTDGFAELEQLVSEHSVGETVPFTVVRDGARRDLEVTLDRHPGEDSVRIVRTPWSQLRRPKYETDLLDDFTELAGPGSDATVEVYCEGQRVALGTVVDADGLVVTKASELDGPVTLRVGGRRLEASVLGSDPDYDVALLRVDAELAAVRLDPRPLEPGQWVISPDVRSLPLSVGVVSGPLRSVPTRYGYLGVVLDEDLGEPRISEVVANSGAERAGLLPGDVLLGIEGREVRRVREVTEAVRAFRPTSDVTIAYRRDGVESKVRATLGVHPMEEGQQVAAQDRDSGPLSRIRSGFPRAIPHDSVLLPEQCGGPLVDSTGAVVGINVARAGRAASYAVPSGVLLELLAELRRSELR